MLPFDIPSIINGLIWGILFQILSILLYVWESDLNMRVCMFLVNSLFNNSPDNISWLDVPRWQDCHIMSSHVSLKCHRHHISACLSRAPFLSQCTYLDKHSKVQERESFYYFASKRSEICTVVCLKLYFSLLMIKSKGCFS